MKIIILYWSKGDNKPFIHASNVMAGYFRRFGKIVEVLDAENPELFNILELERVRGIEYVLTFQGIGTGLTLNRDGEHINIWDLLKIPVICLHADYPAHAIQNHELDSPHCKHLYYDEAACLFSNEHLRTKRSASIVAMPPPQPEVIIPREEDVFFVFPKNITHPNQLEREAKDLINYDELFEYFMNTIESIKFMIANTKGFVDFHSILDLELLKHPKFRQILDRQYFNMLCFFHAKLDFYIRNFKAVTLLERLHDFPVRIYGRGWDVYKRNKSIHHEFFDGRDASDSTELFSSGLGVIDVSPFRGFHDRSLRAITNRTPFFTNAETDFDFAKSKEFLGLFYNFTNNDIESKAAAIFDDPRHHREQAILFSEKYQAVNRFDTFMLTLDFHATALGNMNI